MDMQQFIASQEFLTCMTFSFAILDRLVMTSCQVNLHYRHINNLLNSHFDKHHQYRIVPRTYDRESQLQSIINLEYGDCFRTLALNKRYAPTSFVRSRAFNGRLPPLDQLRLRRAPRPHGQVYREVRQLHRSRTQASP